MFPVKVKATGHGLGFNSYPVEFEFNAFDEDSDDEVRAKAFRRAKDQTACSSVTVNSVEFTRPECE